MRLGSQFTRAMFLGALGLAAACSEEPAGGSAPPKSDAAEDRAAADDAGDDRGTANDGGTIDASVDGGPSDTPLVDASPEGDVDDCSCTLVDSGLSSPLPGNGVMSLPCYCKMPWSGVGPAPACASFAEATRCDGSQKPFSLETYTNCNLVTVWYSTGLSVDARVYDHTTHELVGAFRGTDHSLPCGASQAFMLMTGKIPGPECTSAKIEFPCADAGPTDGGLADTPAADSADDADGADLCQCVPDDRNEGGKVSLGCMCARGLCSSYDEALTQCSSGAPPEANHVDDYEACNLVVIHSAASPFGGSSRAYDRTTHELVGVRNGSDVQSYPCGDASVFGVEGGRFPPADCRVSRSTPRCPRDGG